MTIHFNIGEAKAQLSKLIAAALRGEEVVIDKDGVPQVRLMPVAERREADLAERERKINEILARVDAMDGSKLAMNGYPPDSRYWGCDAP